MAKECIYNCPRIRAQIREIQSDNTWSGPMAFHPDIFSSDENPGVGKLLKLCEASYDCPGPQTAEFEVVKGFFKRHTEYETSTICGLQES
jgi:hypothetical protein